MNQVHGKAFQQIILPSLHQFQNQRSPKGASLSKSSFLLRNSFSLEIYQEFLKWKKKDAEVQKQKKEILAQISEVKQKIKERKLSKESLKNKETTSSKIF